MTQETSPGVHPLDQHRDPSEVALVESLAARAAARHSGDPARMRRANEYSNATRVGDGIAVRIAWTPVDMSREAALVRALPKEVGHPKILGEGASEGHGRVVTREVHGQNLAEAWPTLTPAEQRRAVHQLGAARVLHEATAAVRRAGGALGLPADQRSRIHGLVDGFFRLAPLASQVVDDGDLALMNALWDGEVVALLDLEYALLGPVEIGLCRLVCEARVSINGRRVDSDAGGAAVLDQLRDLDIWLAQDGAGEPV